MRAIVLQHDEDGPAELLDEWARERGIEFVVAHVPRVERLPDPREFDCAILLGSEAHVYAGVDPWIPGELQWVRDADAASVPMLGICFGAQAIAAALGGVVRRAPVQEIGLDHDLKERERELILATLRVTGGSRKLAAERLGISPRTLRHKLQQFKAAGVQVPRLIDTQFATA